MKIGKTHIPDGCVKRWGFTLVGDDVHLIVCMEPRLYLMGGVPKSYHFIRRNTTECYPFSEYELLEEQH